MTIRHDNTGMDTLKGIQLHTLRSDLLDTAQSGQNEGDKNA